MLVVATMKAKNKNKNENENENMQRTTLKHEQGLARSGNLRGGWTGSCAEASTECQVWRISSQEKARCVAAKQVFGVESLGKARSLLVACHLM